MDAVPWAKLGVIRRRKETHKCGVRLGLGPFLWSREGTYGHDTKLL